MEVACSWYVTSTKIAQQLILSVMLLHTFQMDAWLLFLFLHLHVSFTLIESVFRAVKEKQVLLLADVQSQLCEWVKLHQKCRLVSVYSMLLPVIYVAHLSE